MLGVIRYVLAMMVACSHLWPGAIPWQGIYAVFCFYVISGYLMTVVLNEVYIGDSGTLRYLLNRGLRIYPAYLSVLALSVAFVFLYPQTGITPLDYGLRLEHVLRQPQSLSDWFANLTLWPPWEGGNLVVSQAWSLRVELFFYVAMIFLVRSRTRVLAWFLVSVGLVVWQQLQDQPFIYRYTGLAGSSIAFSLGALVYHVRPRIRLSAYHLPVAVCLFLLHTLFAADLWGFDREPDLRRLMETGTFGLYMSTVLGAWVLLVLQALKPNERPRGLALWLGDLAYPVFLVHWLVAAGLIAAGLTFQDKLVFLPVAFLLINLLALLTHRYIEAPIDHVFRAAVRRGLRPTASP